RRQERPVEAGSDRPLRCRGPLVGLHQAVDRASQAHRRGCCAGEESVSRLIRYNFDAVRRMRLPPATAGVASAISFSEFLPSTLNSGPDWMTYVSPSSLRANTLPL